MLYKMCHSEERKRVSVFDPGSPAIQILDCWGGSGHEQRRGIGSRCRFAEAWQSAEL